MVRARSGFDLVSQYLTLPFLDWSSKKELDYPPFCLDSKGGYLVVSGGGGESKTGIPNELVRTNN